MFAAAVLAGDLELLGVEGPQAGLELGQGFWGQSSVEATGTVPVSPGAQVTAPVECGPPSLIILGRTSGRDDLAARLAQSFETASAGLVDQPARRVGVNFGCGRNLTRLGCG